MLPMHSRKFQNKYMLLAHHIASQNDTCSSRKVGCVIVDKNNKVKGIGYNGPPAGTPHCDTIQYLEEMVWPKLTDEQKESLRLAYGDPKTALLNCKTCPRKFLGYKSGECSNLCSCQHAESNAIINAACDLSNTALYCTCAPCFNCTGIIINARIVEVHFPSSEIYSEHFRFLLDQVQILLVQHSDQYKVY